MTPSVLFSFSEDVSAEFIEYQMGNGKRNGHKRTDWLDDPLSYEELDMVRNSNLPYSVEAALEYLEFQCGSNHQEQLRWDEDFRKRQIKSTSRTEAIHDGPIDMLRKECAIFIRPMDQGQFYKYVA